MHYTELKRVWSELTAPGAAFETATIQQLVVNAISDEAIKFIDSVFPGNGMRSEARVILHLMLIRRPVLQTNNDLRRHLPRVLFRVLVVRFSRDLLQEGLHVGSRDAIWRKLRVQHVPIEQSY